MNKAFNNTNVRTVRAKDVKAGDTVLVMGRKFKVDDVDPDYESKVVTIYMDGDSGTDFDFGDRIELAKSQTEKTIRHEGDKWNLYSRSTGKLLGSHNTKAGAERQEAAIQANKVQDFKSAYKDVIYPKLDDFIEDEIEGEEAYREVADAAPNDSVRDRFNEMADEERHHRQMLEDMKDETTKTLKDYLSGKNKLPHAIHKSFKEYWKDKSLMLQNQAMEEVVQIAESKPDWESYARNYLKDKGLSPQETNEVIEVVKEKYFDHE
jgi:hypothetical protein